MRQKRMDIGSPYHLLLFGAAESDSGLRFDTVEVRSSRILAALKGLLIRSGAENTLGTF